MNCLGTIKNGVVILDETRAFQEGTRVRVDSEPDLAHTGRGTAQAILSSDIKWVGPAAELDRLLAEVQQMRDTDADLQCERDK